MNSFPDYSKELIFAFTYRRGYNTGSITVQQIGYDPGPYPCDEKVQEGFLSAAFTYDYTGTNVGIHDYARIPTKVAPFIISPSIGDPSPDCRPRQSGYCPPRYEANFLLAEGSHAFEVSSSWNVQLVGRTGLFNLKVVGLRDQIDIPGPFNLPANEQWLRDSNGNILGMVEVEIKDNEGFTHQDQLLIGVQAPPGRPTLHAKEEGNNAVELSYIADGATSFKIYYGGTSGSYNGTGLPGGPSPISVGSQTSYTLTGLATFRPYYIAVKGFNNQGESLYSSEVIVHPRHIFDLSNPYHVPYELLAGCLLPDQHLVLWLPFDEAGGAVAANTSAFSGHDGSKKGAPSSTPGRVGSGLCFNGTSDYVEMPSYPEINFGLHDFSLETWVKPSLGDSVRVLIDKRDEPRSFNPVVGYSFFLYNGRLALQLADGTYANYISNVVVPTDGNWHHVAVTVRRSSATGGQFYLDGQPVDKVFDPTGHQGSLSATNPLRIGLRSSSLTGFFHGCLDEVQAMEQALTPDEVLSHFHAGPSGTCK
jgi:hypothetical protein